ncbi:MAG: hypothetical protein OEV37_03470 [Candidatus Berkelbacteria bacterium]|nr:hypothetical protein [Candidatus Berkelbacteria bacterium]
MRKLFYAGLGNLVVGAIILGISYQRFVSADIADEVIAEGANTLMIFFIIGAALIIISIVFFLIAVSVGSK